MASVKPTLRKTLTNSLADKQLLVAASSKPAKKPSRKPADNELLARLVADVTAAHKTGKFLVLVADIDPARGSKSLLARLHTNGFPIGTDADFNFLIETGRKALFGK